MTGSSTRALLAALLLSATVACGGGTDEAEPAPEPASSTSAPSSESPTASPTATRQATSAPEVVETIATGLDAPWGIAFLPDGSAFVSERDNGRIVHVNDGGSNRVRPIGEVPGVVPGGEGGLLGIAVSPDFRNDRQVYAYFTAANDNRVVRMSYDPRRPAGQQLTAPEAILTGIEKSAIHNGGRIAFGPDGMLYVATGDASERGSSQSDDSLNGKILRITRDGEPAPGNPDSSRIFSKGHRNVQGLAWDGSGQLWATEFGQNTWDELNKISRGGNYGWPEVEGDQNSNRFVDPQVTWSPANASPSGLAISGDVAYVASLRGARLWRVPLRDGSAGEPEDFFVGEYGRIRTVAVAPDGSLWVMTSNTDGRGAVRDGDDRILRVSTS